MHYDVVIAGGGFAGAYCAKTLGKLLGKGGEKRVALIAERNVLVFQPMLAEVAGSSLSPSAVVNPLRLLCRHVDVLQGGIHRIDWATKTLTLDGGRFTRNHAVTFDHLVLTLGSVTDLSRVPGMADHGRPMKSVADALRLRSTLINRLEEANLVEDAAMRARLLTFVVVGGGYTGVETAGQVQDFLRGSQKYYANLRDSKIRVVLVHGHPSLLIEIGQKLGEHALVVLKKRGIEVLLSTRVAEATASKVIFADGSFIEGHTIISTIGNAPNPVVLDLCRQLGIETEKGRVPTEPSMRVAGHPNLWTAGDCAAVPWNDRGELKISPPTAQLALRQGVQLGRNVARALAGQELKPFTYRYMGQLATIGEREAVAEVFGFHFSGFFAWWMWRTIYLGKLPGVLRKLRVMIDWTFELIFPRDLSLLLPPPDEILRPIHLEKGEGLFSRGDPCRAFYYVRRGTVELHEEGAAPRTLHAGAIIDQAELDGNNHWRVGAVATESSDVVVIRGRAHELLQTELRLTARGTA
ncbi:FAD-dependent oxidoreductase [Rariglobus hedericola]|uniref:NADH:ubiquinone reductase (non-electrogenic) n=1 Tax=Rariglobus hedericola TaxID=2597822 RepID=A0A556QJ26_9BACT|nr:FAD-dependent oxidoreductase [Rariglobus hedericola]TSJ76611.1 cyclic nucleotide-binding domain-containing protein [Rariglobus hedericola]